MKTKICILFSTLTTISITLLTACAWAQAPDFHWTQDLGGPDWDEGFGIAVDEVANCFCGGIFSGTATFGTNELTSYGGKDVFLAKFNSSGSLQWVRQAGGPNDDGIYCLAVDPSGSCLATGYFTGNAVFGANTLTNALSPQMFVAEYDTDGKLQWARQATGPGSSTGVGIAVDTNGNYLVAGLFSGTIYLGGTNLTSDGGNDGFVAKFSSAGVLAWVRQVGGPNEDGAYGVAVDSSGNCYLKGYFTSAANVGATNLTSPTPTAMFLAKYDPAGTLQWVRQANGTHLNRGGLNVAVDSYGNAYLAGQFSGTATFGSSNVLSQGHDDIFIAKYNNEGTLQWIQTAGGTDDDYGESLAIDTKGNCYVTGGFNGTASFGNTNLISSGAYDIFIAQCSTDGIFQWARRAGGTGDDWGNRIAVSRGGNCYVTGAFTNNATFGPTNLTSAGGWDVFVTKLGFPLNISITQTNHTPTLSVRGDDGSKARIEYATNLPASTDWLPLATNLVPYSSIDLASTNSPNRFYRAVLMQ